MHVDLDVFYASVEQRNRPESRGRPVRLIGLGIAGWVPPSPVQGELFAVDTASPSAPRERLYETLDDISRKFGKGSVRRGLRRKQ